MSEGPATARRGGMSRNKVIEKATEHTGYSRARGYQIADVREWKAS